MLCYVMLLHQYMLHKTDITLYYKHLYYRLSIVDKDLTARSVPENQS